MRSTLYQIFDALIPFSGDLSTGQLYTAFGSVCLAIVALAAWLLYDAYRVAAIERLRADIEAEKRLAAEDERDSQRRRGLDAIMQSGQMPARKVYSISDRKGA